MSAQAPSQPSLCPSEPPLGSETQQAHLVLECQVAARVHSCQPSIFGSWSRWAHARPWTIFWRSLSARKAASSSAVAGSNAAFSTGADMLQVLCCGVARCEGAQAGGPTLLDERAAWDLLGDR